MDIMEMGFGLYGLDCTGSGQGPVYSSCEHGNEPSGFRRVLANFLNSCTTNLGTR
jgi:hypothetical protein